MFLRYRLVLQSLILLIRSSICDVLMACVQHGSVRVRLTLPLHRRYFCIPWTYQGLQDLPTLVTRGFL